MSRSQNQNLCWARSQGQNFSVDPEMYVATAVDRQYTFPHHLSQSPIDVCGGDSPYITARFSELPEPTVNIHPRRVTDVAQIEFCTPRYQSEIHSSSIARLAPKSREDYPPANLNESLVDDRPCWSLLSNTTLQISVNNSDQWSEWFQNAFELLRQLACRDIAREWIGVIHPKKQATHPYNGRLVGNDILTPEATKPPYWPKGVRHKEPDHISKKERVDLLLHLLMNTPHRQITSNSVRPKLIYAETMQLALTKVRGKLDHFQWDIICHMIRARSKVERLSSQKRDLQQLIHVPDYSGISHKLMRESMDVKRDILLRNNQNSNTGNEHDSKGVFAQSNRRSPLLNMGASISEVSAETSYLEQLHHGPVETWPPNSAMMPLMFKTLPLIPTSPIFTDNEHSEMQHSRPQDRSLRAACTNSPRANIIYNQTDLQVDTDYQFAGNVQNSFGYEDTQSFDLTYCQVPKLESYGRG